jgi:hypothetical protein
MESIMAYRILTTAAVLVALAAPALAGETTTKIERSGFCYRGNCSAETKITREEPSKPNVGYLPNFSGTGGGGGGGSAANSETVIYTMPAAAPVAPADPRCAKLNACLKIH